MRSLFSKIFACFWLSHLLAVVLVYVLLTAADSQRGEPPRPMPSILPSETLVQRAQSAAALFERDQNSAHLASYLQQIEKQSGLNAVLFDASGAERSGRPIPAGARALEKRAAQSGEVEFSASREGVMGARRVQMAKGNRYVLAALMPRPAPPRAGLGRRERFEIARFIAVFFSANLIAYGLALYLAAPTRKLRHATRQLAGGDFSTRVGAQMGRRRDELADLGRDFDLMAERIQSLLVSERRLLGDISHELRSPLARMQVALDLSLQSADPETRGFLERIERESARLNALIGQLLTLTRLESAGTETRRQPIDMAQLLDEIASDADFEASAHNRRVRVTACDECRVSGDAALLRSAIENVVRNAAHYTTEETTVEISLRNESSHSESSHSESSHSESSHMSTHVGEKNQAIISVRDYGAGVPESSLEHLFDPFYRVADARDRKSGGVGLGLSITARAIRFHGGEVEAKNASGGGLLVEIRLPVAD